MSKDYGGHAFPAHGSMGEVISEGMFLRDYFAAQAVQSIAADSELSYTYVSSVIGIPSEEFKAEIHWPIYLAKMAYRTADAMLLERSK